MSRILITGGAGFIGTNLVTELMKRNHQISIIDDLSTGLIQNIPTANVKFFNGSITDEKLVEMAMTDVDAVVHLAARGSVPRSIVNPKATFDVNVNGTQNILEMVRNIGCKYIFSSSSSVYGLNDQLPKIEKMWMQPLTPYAASKLAGEALSLAYGNTYNLRTMVFRLFNVFGPNQRPDHQYSAVIPKWIWAAQNGLPLRIHGDGNQTRDFTYVKSVVDVIVETLEGDYYSDTPINLAYGNRISLNYLIEKMRDFYPDLSIEKDEVRAGDVKDSKNDPKLINELFPELCPRNFDESLRETILWLANYGKQISGGPDITD